MSEYYRSGNNLRGLINSLKLRPEDAAKKLSVPLGEFNSYLAGEKEMSAEIIKRAADVWGLSERDFYIIPDDSPEGVKIMLAEESSKTSRLMERAGKPYYEYRDTAMSRVSLFRPEWIKELCVVADNNSENQAPQWNNGHFEHQFTYFIGPVNFYYKEESGEKKVAVMNTGDSMYITPFVSHTFATRQNDEGKNGLILALTYGNKLSGDTQQELSALGIDLAYEYALDFSSKERAAASLLRFHREAASLDYKELSNRAGISIEDLVAYESSQTVFSSSEIKRLALALNINYNDLLPPDYIEKKVIVKYYLDALRWMFPADDPAYQMVELAGTKHLPYSKSLEVNILTSENKYSLDLKAGLHQYGYNVGEGPVEINWKLGEKYYSKYVQSGDSFYMKPFVAHNFRGKKGKLLILRIGGRTAGEAQKKLSLIGKENSERAIAETILWFNKEGKNNV